MDLISKKELLLTTGISYGQLYRWKREGLIPEEWFIKQSAYTGQETFFPREQVLERVASILALKDTHSLEELAGLLSDERALTVPADLFAELLSTNAQTAHGEADYGRLPEILAQQDFSLAEIALAGMLWGKAASVGMQSGESDVLIRQGALVLGTLKAGGLHCTLFRADGRCHLCFTRGDERPLFSREVTVLDWLPLDEAVAALKTRVDALRAAHRKENTHDE